jgi:hypothetical protein
MGLLNLLEDKQRTFLQARLAAERVITVYGHVTCDLSQALLEPGDHHLRVVALCGRVTILCPAYLSLEIDDTSLFSTVTIATNGQVTVERPAGMWQSEWFDQTDTRLFLSIKGFLGEVHVVQLPLHDAPATEYALDESPVNGRAGYEGETQKLARQ